MSVAWLSPAAAVPAQSIGFSGALPDIKKVNVQSAHVYDYTFASAPTDWRVQSGVWAMTHRWSCDPGWNWFGGQSEDIAAIWNKHRFIGDVSAHCYVSFKMGMPGKPESWWESPMDVAVTISGDGRNPSSGYSFIAGADDNRHTVLLRNGEMVAESRAPSALMTSPIDKYPDDAQQHRHWWYLRLSKIGSRVECWLDNQLVLTYDDPHPLNAGQVAVWTYNNGIMLARAQIYYANEQHARYVKAAARPRVTLVSPISVSPRPKNIQVAARSAKR